MVGLLRVPPYLLVRYDMTIRELLARVRQEKPNSFHDAKLIEFLNEIEYDTADQLNVEFSGYTDADPHDDQDKTLLVPAPYDKLYISFLKAKIDHANEELASYQNHAAQFTQDFADFVDWVVRTRQERGKKMPKRFRHTF